MNSEIEQNWEKILSCLETEFGITPVSFKTFIKPLKYYDDDGSTLTLLLDDEELAPYDTTIDFIKKKFGIFIKNSIEEITGKSYNVVYISKDDITTYNKKKDIKDNVSKRSAEANLNPRYTFDTFVVGANNKFAHAAALAVAESPAEMYNPLFIYGGAGLGKTHLMHSIAHYILEKDDNAKVLYVTSENFTNELIESIRGDNANPIKFREKYRSIDVLIIDDIQFIIGKEGTQEEFFNTFNELQEKRKQIVISSDKPPKEFKTLEERLRSRFEMGLIADIQPPDYETRMAILRKKEEIDGLNIDNDILDYIAANINSNIRELEGALNKVVALGKLENKVVTLDLAEEALKDIISPTAKKEITAERIVEVVADQYNINPQDLIGSKKSKNIAYPRQIAMYLCRNLTNMSFQDIGAYLGNRDHSTILHGYDKIETDLKDEKKSGRKELSDRLDVLKKKLAP